MWKKILDNVLYFMNNLYPAAHSQSYWTYESVDKALSWALYCENVVKKTKNNGIFEKAFESSNIDGALSYKELENARFLILSLLLQNHLIDYEVKCYIKNKSKEIFNPEDSERISSILQQQLLCEKVLSDIHTSEELQVSYNTKCICEVLPFASDEQIHKKFKELTNTGLATILDEILYQTGTAQVDRFSKWMNDYLLPSPRDDVHKCVILSLCKLENVKLYNLLESNEDLLFSFISYIHAAGNLLRYVEGTWVQPNNDSSVLPFSELVALYSKLQSNKRFGKHLVKRVLKWTSTDNGAVWIDIMSA